MLRLCGPDERSSFVTSSTKHGLVKTRQQSSGSQQSAGPPAQSDWACCCLLLPCAADKCHDGGTRGGHKVQVSQSAWRAGNGVLLHALVGRCSHTTNTAMQDTHQHATSHSPTCQLPKLWHQHVLQQDCAVQTSAHQQRCAAKSCQARRSLARTLQLAWHAPLVSHHLNSKVQGARGRNDPSTTELPKMSLNASTVSTGSRR